MDVKNLATSLASHSMIFYEKQLWSKMIHEGPYTIMAPKTDWRQVKLLGRPWQDLLFSIGEIVFLLTLIPMWIAHTNVPLFTGVGTAFMLYAFTLAHISYKNWITVILSFVTATLWFLIGLGVYLV